MLLMIAFVLWVAAAAWFLVAWAMFGARNRRQARVTEALYELGLDAA